MTQKSSAKNTRFFKSRLAFAIAAQMLTYGNALAGPTGGEVVGGAGSIEQQGTATTITQTSEKMAIDWQSFDVGKDERVNFVQPGQSAVALNRILSNNGSEILGRIDANGHVILVNPHGVVFGEGAVVNAGGLIASGLQINPDDFMNGDLVFKRIEGTDGTVINAGMINAASGGNVALIGTEVENRGLISARLGSVTLASGKEAVLTFDESGLLGVQVDEAILQSELGDKAAITNSGELKAEGGRILLSASTTRDVFSQAVNWGDQKQARSVTYNDDGSFTLAAGGDVVNSGEITVSGETAGNIVALGENITSTGKIHADTTQGAGGNIELHSNTTTIISEEGIVTANAEQGGDVKILGKNVGLFDSAGVEAIGENGGGQVLVGGDQEGLNNQIRNADFVYINENASINASATNSGDGGTAIVFAEDTARIHGNLSARGGEFEGNGGFVETSGKKSFSITASPDVSAVNGVAGHWLIDPYDIVVLGGNSNDDGSDEFEFESSPNGSTISAATINSALNRGATVTLRTGLSEEDANAKGGNIIVNNEINFTGSDGATLNLIAHANIEINTNIKASSSALNINLYANESGGDGSITFADKGGRRIEISTNGGDFNVGDDSNVGAHNVNFKGATIDLRHGTNESGRLAVYADQDVDFGDVQFWEQESEIHSSSLSIYAGRIFNIGAPKSYAEVIKLTAANWGFKDRPFIAEGDIEFHNLGDSEFILPEIDATGSLTISSVSNVGQRTGIKVLQEVSVTANGHDVVLNNTDNEFGGSVWVSEANDVSLFSGENLQLGNENKAMSIDGLLTLSSNGDVNQMGGMNVRHGVVITQGKNINLDKKNEIASLSIDNTNNAKIHNEKDLKLNKAKLTDKLHLVIAGELTQGDVFTQDNALAVGQLELGIAGITRLQNPNNRITQLSGEIAGGEILVSDDSLRDKSLRVNLAVSGEASIKARQVDVGDVFLSDRAALTFNDVGTFTLSGGFAGAGAGAGAAANSVTINGRETNGNYTISENALLDGVKLIFNGAGGSDTLWVNKEFVTVELADGTIPEEPLGLVALNIENIQAKSGSGNTLIGAGSSLRGYEWNINGDGKNIVKNLDTNREVSFENFSALGGGSKDDEFKINPGANVQSIQGGGGIDTLSYAAWNGDFEFVIGDHPQGVGAFGEIEVVKGNGDKGVKATLKAPDGDGKNVWEINNGKVSVTFERSGDEVLVLDGEALVPYRGMVFSGFNSIKGGNGVDEFRVKLANHVSDAAYRYTLDGGNEKKINGESHQLDQLMVLDGGDDWEGFYRINESTGKTNFSFKLSSKEMISFDYENMDHVLVDASLDQMNLAGKSGQEDKFKLGPGWWDMNGSQVFYGGRLNGLVVDGGGSDTILLSSRDDPRLLEEDDEGVSSVKKIHLPKNLDLKGRELSFDEDVLLETEFLTLRNFESDVGSENAPLNISVDALTLIDNNGALYLREVENVVLAGLSGGGLVDLSVQLGDLMQGIGIEKSSGGLIFRAASGSIQLRHENNAILVPITLEAADSIELYSKGDLTLAGITAQDLRLEAIGDITSDAFFMVGGETSLVSGGAIKLDSKDNYLNRVTLHAIGNAELTNNVRLTIFDANIGGDLRLDAPGIEFQGLTNARTLTTISTREIWLAGTVITVGDAYLNGARVFGPQTALRNQNGRTYGAKTTNATDRMIEVESLAEIDPAIFSDVKNYFYQDVSIRLPSDQLYDEL